MATPRRSSPLRLVQIGILVAIRSADRTVKVWSCETGKELFTTKKMSSGAVFGLHLVPTENALLLWRE